jgi:glycosyltransferase involved in cell wall biosynthesis
MTMKKKVGIFTTFYKWDEAYSLTSVVKDQLIAHVKNGYEPVLFVLDVFPEFNNLAADPRMWLDIPDGVEVRRVIPQIILEPYAGMGIPEKWREDVDRVKQALLEHATDIEVMLTHDIVFIDTYLPYNIALREAELPCRYFHWIHSAPSPRPQIDGNPHANRYTLPSNSRLVYLNNDKSLDLAEMYGTFLSNVRVVYNSRDPRSFWDLHPLVTHLIDKYDLLSADILSIYPVSAPRMIEGKQVDAVIGIHEQLRKLGYKTKLVICDAHANGHAERIAANERRSNDVIFTSLEGGKSPTMGENKYEDLFPNEHGVPSKVVSDFFRLSNVFIFPTISENCSLILLEAMLAGNLLVLNKDCTGLDEHAGKDNAIYLRFGNFDMGTRKHEHALEREEYLRDIALIIKDEVEHSRPLKAKRRALQRFNYDSVFRTIEPMYYEI